jgi:membrane protease YdiL (CAAX protease family)
MDRLKSPSLLEANLIYLVLGVLLLSVGQIVQSREVYSGLLITEFIIILLPNLAYLKLRGYSLKKVLRLNKISLEQALYSVFIMIFAYPVAVAINAIMILLLSKVTTALPSGIPLPGNLKEFGVGIFIMAIAPGICEEVMFRGTMLDSYERLGHKKSILITAFLFGIFHFNIFNFIGPAFLGIILGVLVYKTNSIYTSIIGHTINNSIALTIGYFVTKYSGQIDQMANQPIPIDQNTQLLASAIMLLIIGTGSLFVMIFLIKKIPGHKASTDNIEFEEVYTENKSIGYLDFVPVIIVVIMFINLNIRFLLN